MPNFDGAVITAHVDQPDLPPCDAPITAETPPSAAGVAARLRATSVGRWPRVVAVLVLGIVAYGASYGQVVADAIAGSRTGYLVVVPVLAVLIASGYRTAPRGVGDSEADWIIATLFGIAGMSTIYLLSARFPALAGLWRLDLIEIVVWLVCVSAVIFGVRHVVHMWPLWLFVLCCATPLPFLMATAVLGGSDLACTVLAAALGALAVFIAGRRAPLSRRVGATLGCLAAGTAAATIADGRVDTLLVVVVAGGLIPVLAAATLARAAGSGDPSGAGGAAPHLSPISLVVLTATSVAILAVTPATATASAVPTAPGNWVTESGLSVSTTFPFVTRFLGHDATLVRYAVPGAEGLPAAAVDVMTTANQAALNDYADAVWYPTSRPLEFEPAEPSNAFPLGARVIHTNADTATNGAALDWYAVTWTWRNGDTSQRVTVIVSQALSGDQPPPPPAPLSMVAAVLRPAMWVTRQQPDAESRVDPLVSQRAVEVANLLLRHSAVMDKPVPGV